MKTGWRAELDGFRALSFHVDFLEGPEAGLGQFLMKILNTRRSALTQPAAQFCYVDLW